MDEENYAAHDMEGLDPLFVHVTAPVTMQEGYTFEAVLADGTPFSCQVPEGGVFEGQTFWVPLPQHIETNRILAPTGRWKDGLFDCCSLGPCHPHLLCAFFCSEISKAQIMTRLHLTWLGRPGPLEATQNTFKVVLILNIAYTVYSLSLSAASVDYDVGEEPLIFSLLKVVGSALFSIWSLYSLCQTRRSVRLQYSIPEERCVGCEDLCCVACCTCCTLSQMARHTGEYETYPGVCLSKTGHPKGTPLTV